MASSELTLEQIFSPHIINDDVITGVASSDALHAAATGIAPLIREKISSEEIVSKLAKSIDKGELRAYTNFPARSDIAVNIGKKLEQITESGSTFCIFSVNSENIMPQSFDADKLTVFLNGIPLYEISRCVPFIDMNVISSVSPTSDSGYLTAASLYTGLLGPTTDKTAIALASAADQSVALGAEISSVAGIEMFVTPQIMSLKNSLRTAIDKARPYLSLESVSIESKSMQSAIVAYKTGKLNLILHDRSRMPDIADLLNPEFWSSVFFQITYGWSHPESVSVKGNKYGELINSLRRTDLFSVLKSSFAMREDGSVAITIDIAANGARELNRLRFSDGDPKLVSAQETLIKLGELLRAARSGVAGPEGNKNRFKEIRGSQILTGAENPESLIEPDPELEAQINQLIRDFDKIGQKKDEINELLKRLKEVYGTGDEKKQAIGALHNVREGINGVISALIIDATTGDDEFLNVQGVIERISESGDISKEVETRFKETEKKIKELETRAKSAAPKDGARLRNQAKMLAGATAITTRSKRKYVSFGKLLVHFIIKPILAQGRFDDVQIFCFPLNSNAGLAGKPATQREIGINIASFIIDVAEFTSALSQQARQRRTPDMQLVEFLEFVTTTFMDDPRSYMYGEQRKYDPRDLGNLSATAKLKDAKPKPGKKKSEAEELNESIGAVEFKLPNVSYFVESFLKRTSEKTLRVLRILIFDEHATAYSENVDLLRKARDDSLNDKDVIDRLAGAGITTLGAGGVSEFMMATMPHATYGTAGSMITNASLTNQQDNNLATVMLLRSGRSRTGVPRGLNEGTLPMRILASTVNISMIGCPILDYGQQLFINFNTLTTADNIYGVIGVTHTFEPGKFQTTAQLQMIDAWGKYETFSEKINNASLKLSSK